MILRLFIQSSQTKVLNNLGQFGRSVKRGTKAPLFVLFLLPLDDILVQRGRSNPPFHVHSMTFKEFKDSELPLKQVIYGPSTRLKLYVFPFSRINPVCLLFHFCSFSVHYFVKLSHSHTHSENQFQGGKPFMWYDLTVVYIKAIATNKDSRFLHVQENIDEYQNHCKLCGWMQ